MDKDKQPHNLYLSSTKLLAASILSAFIVASGIAAYASQDATSNQSPSDLGNTYKHFTR